MGFLTDLTDGLRAAFAGAPPDLDRLRAAATAAPPVRPFGAALASGAERDGIALIAEVKRSSPSVGPIAPEVDPVAQARRYAEAGAAAVSVLTEHDHFGGSLEDLRSVRAAIEPPVLRKDFIVHEAQVWEARAAGADAVLLITACLDEQELPALIAVSRAAGMEPLLETHADADIERALATDARVIGVNARDLETLEVDVEASIRRIRALASSARCIVAESGIASNADVAAARAAGASAILVGETLMRSGDPAATVHRLIHGEAVG
jgi:indole-3-glycerol phosphate synthase